MSDLLHRLRGKYRCGPDGIYEDRDFGSFTPRICQEAAEEIERLQKEVRRLQDGIANTHEVFADSLELAENLQSMATELEPSEACLLNESATSLVGMYVRIKELHQ